MFSFAFAILISAASTANAQGAPASWGDLAVSAGRVDFDLSGTGHARGVVIRTTRYLSPHVNLEFRGLYAQYCGDQIRGECVPNQLSGAVKRKTSE